MSCAHSDIQNCVKLFLNFSS